MSTASITPYLPRTKSDFRQSFTSLGRDLAAGLWVARDASIVSFNAELQQADVALNSLVVIGYLNLGNGQTKAVTRTYPVFPAVPVMFPGGGGAAMTFPIAPGDTCLLIFIDRDFSDWYTSGQTGLPPRTSRIHNPSDAVCIVGLRSVRNPLSTVSETDAQFYGPDGPNKGLISVAAKVGIGNDTGQLVTALDALATALVNWVDTHGDTPSAGTISNINDAKAQWDAILK